MKSKTSERGTALRKSKGKVELKTLPKKSVQKTKAVKSSRTNAKKSVAVKSAKSGVKKSVPVKASSNKKRAPKLATVKTAKENAKKPAMKKSTNNSVQKSVVKTVTKKSAQKPVKSAKRGPKISTRKNVQSRKNQSPKKTIKKNKFELRGEALKLHNKKGYLSYKPEDASSDWSGNSDDEGSVMSGVLEENICFECGRSTMEDDKNTIVMCDRCDGEYHAACQQLERIPRISWKCKDCTDEERLYNASDYKLDIFKVKSYILWEEV